MMDDARYDQLVEAALKGGSLAAADRILLFPEIVNRCRSAIRREQVYRSMRSELRHNMLSVLAALFEIDKLMDDHKASNEAKRKLSDALLLLRTNLKKIEDAGHEHLG